MREQSWRCGQGGGEILGRKKGPGEIEGDISEDSGPGTPGTRNSGVTGGLTVEPAADGILIGEGMKGVDEGPSNSVSGVRRWPGGERKKGRRRWPRYDLKSLLYDQKG